MKLTGRTKHPFVTVEVETDGKRSWRKLDVRDLIQPDAGVRAAGEGTVKVALAEEGVTELKHRAAEVDAFEKAVAVMPSAPIGRIYGGGHE